MLIFDNILFASFIPQILMFVGFLSCVTVPFFSHHAETDVIFPQDSNSIELTTEKNDVFSTVHFFDLHDFQTDAVSSDNSVTPFYPAVLEYKYREINGHFLARAEDSTLFSRPPPSFFSFV